MEEFLKVDIYELLNIDVTAEEKEIKSAYRKKALSCHPDKNPDDPKAAELFQQLSKALAILTDCKARAAYDQVLRAKKAAILRNRTLESKRKKLKEDLEAREQAAREKKNAEFNALRNLEQEIIRLRKEGYKLVEQVNEVLRQQILEQKEQAKAGLKSDHETELPKLKIKWSVSKGDAVKTNYTEDELKAILGKHGHLTCLVVSKKRKGSAIAEFSDIQAAESAIKCETGRLDNPLKLSWISGKPANSGSDHITKDFVNKKTDDIAGTSINNSVPIPNDSSKITFRDYESVVMMKMRQAEERKKLIQQIKDEDE